MANLWSKVKDGSWLLEVMLVGIVGSFFPDPPLRDPVDPPPELLSLLDTEPLLLSSSKFVGITFKGGGKWDVSLIWRIP